MAPLLIFTRLTRANIREIEVYSQYQIMLFFTVRQMPTCFFLRKMTDIHKNGCFYGISSSYTSVQSSTFHQISLCLTCLAEFLELFHSFFFCYSSKGIGLSIFSEIIFNH